MVKKAEPEIELAHGVDRSRFWWYDIYIHRSRRPNESSELATPQQKRTEKAPQTSSIEKRPPSQASTEEPVDSNRANMIP
jgi:hypothetical protein